MDESEADRRQCRMGIGSIGSPADDEVQMDSGMCPADSAGVFEIENPDPDGSNHIKPLCERHRDLLDQGPGLLIGEVDLPSSGGGPDA